MIDTLLATIDATVADLKNLPQIATQCAHLENASDQEISQLLERLVEKTKSQPSGELFHALNPVIFALAMGEPKRESADPEYSWPAGRLEQVRTIYSASGSGSPLRNSILYWLAPGIAPCRSRDNRIESWVELLCNDPPSHRSSIPIAFGPAMNNSLQPDPEMLQRLLNGTIEHQHVAPAVFDLLNFYVRNGRIDSHPASDRAESLSDLLGMLSGQLGRIEEGEIDPKVDNPDVIGRKVSDSVALIVSICDTLALIGYEPAIGRMHQAAGLRHRRVQTEAAAALARLGDEFGSELLVRLADEPVARLRVLNYAEELGISDKISLANRGEIAVAESHLAIWLSEPTQMGIAPSRIKLVDNREMYWPGYEHPVQCYLFQYEYGSAEQPFTNIAICGPMTHAVSADLTSLSHEDTYALFAGWQTVHEEILQLSSDRARQSFPNDWKRIESRLFEEPDFKDLQIESAGRFFGRLVVLANGVHKAKGRGTLIVDDRECTFISEGNPTSPIDIPTAWAIWQGRQLLTTFNPA